MSIVNSIINVINEKANTIDVVDIIGTIAYTSNNKYSANTVSSVEVVNNLRNILEDESTNHVVVFYINSPGGTAAAGEEIAMMINKLRRKNIKTVATIGDTGCSAAYLIASQCDIIFANRMSILGSIGVLMPIPNISALSDKLGIKVQYLKAGKMKDIGNMFREMTEEECDYIEQLLKESHADFIKMVRSRRDIEDDNMFDGRFVTAKIAMEKNLIDKYGNSDDAIEYVINELLKTERKNVKIKSYHKKKSILQYVFQSFDLIPEILTNKISHVIS